MFSLSAPPPPSHPSIPNGCGEGQPGGKHAESVLGQSREAHSVLWDTEKGDERMQSAELTGVQSIARPALIIAGVFKWALKGQCKISKYKATIIRREGEKKKSKRL